MNESHDIQIEEKWNEITNRLDASVDHATMTIDRYTSAKLLSKNYLRKKSREPELKTREPLEFDGT